jgi:murein DD-endopeptidase MepM/ murein hydrolase activator NlpD
MTPVTALLSTGCVEGQGFGQNFNPSYHDGGLLGHTGIDINCGWGTPIASLTSGVVYSTYPISQPASDGYTAVFVITETPLETFEFSYGHVSEIDCTIGQEVKVGDIVAKECAHRSMATMFSG